MVVFFSRDGKGSGFLIAGNTKSSVLYDAQKLRRLQLKQDQSYVNIVAIIHQHSVARV